MSDEKVVKRVKAKTTSTKAKSIKMTTKEKSAVKKVQKTKAVNKLPTAKRGYLAGAWYELRQVHWTNRKATWGLTLAVILFSTFFAVLILFFDNIFNWALQLIFN